MWPEALGLDFIHPSFSGSYLTSLEVRMFAPLLLHFFKGKKKFMQQEHHIKMLFYELLLQGGYWLGIFLWKELQHNEINIDISNLLLEEPVLRQSRYASKDSDLITILR